MPRGQGICGLTNLHVHPVLMACVAPDTTVAISSGSAVRRPRTGPGGGTWPRSRCPATPPGSRSASRQRSGKPGTPSGEPARTAKPRCSPTPGALRLHKVERVGEVDELLQGEVRHRVPGLLRDAQQEVCDAPRVEGGLLTHLVGTPHASSHARPPA